MNLKATPRTSEIIVVRPVLDHIAEVSQQIPRERISERASQIQEQIVEVVKVTPQDLVYSRH